MPKKYEVKNKYGQKIGTAVEKPSSDVGCIIGLLFVIVFGVFLLALSLIFAFSRTVFESSSRRELIDVGKFCVVIVLGFLVAYFFFLGGALILDPGSQVFINNFFGFGYVEYLKPPWHIIYSLVPILPATILIITLTWGFLRQNWGSAFIKVTKIYIKNFRLFWGNIFGFF